MARYWSIRYGTERYPERVARRLRALNIAVWIGTGVSTGFAITQVFNPTPGLWKVATINVLAVPLFAGVPLLHRFGALAAPLALFAILYGGFFLIIALVGTGAGMQLYYLVGAALAVPFFGTEHIVLGAIFTAVSAAIVIAVEALVPYDTGLEPATMLFGTFIVTVIVSCGTLFMIVYYAFHQASRAEATAQREYERSESLLANILPAAVADRLKRRGDDVIADRYDDASILFADMAGFTARASDMAPDELVQFLNGIFSEFDRLVDRHRLEKIKTTGDAYMVVSGVPLPRVDHTAALARFALDMRELAARWRDAAGSAAPIRIGMASGPVVAGVVGTRKFFYDVWGDAVNLASRMESTGIEGRIQVSLAAYEHLKSDFLLEPRGAVEVKGKGTLPTWFLMAPLGPGADAVGRGGGGLNAGRETLGP
ncbi:MAG TPA: adenylate/guanylate cyclase domain-containing protein [Stellaceae bacterium]|nr:adenylate/guanylate cyclase domain-containing protein [Stellaceae bacterium]